MTPDPSDPSSATPSTPAGSHTRLLGSWRAWSIPTPRWTEPSSPPARPARFAMSSVYQRHADQHRRPDEVAARRGVRVRPNYDGTDTIEITLEELEVVVCPQFR